jgi:hypothetical protein
MGSFGNYLAVLAVGLSLGAVVVTVLRRPLFDVVAELCGTRTRAAFWTSYLGTLLVLVPLLFASWIGADRDLSRSLERGIAWVLLGLIGALLVIGLSLSRSSRPDAAAASAPTPDPAE